MNRCLFLGRLGQDVDLKHTPSGTAVANCSMAVDTPFKTASGKWDSKAEWINMVIFGKQAEVMNQRLGKGDQIAIEGRMQTRSWEGQDGKKNYKTEIVVDKFFFTGSPNSKAKKQPVEHPKVDGKSIETSSDFAQDNIPF